MSCHECSNKLIEFVEGRMDPIQCRELEMHLAICHDCREFYYKLQEAFQYIENDKEVSFDPFMYTRVRSAVEITQQNHAVWSTRRILQPVFVTLIFLLITFTGIWLGKGYFYQNTLADDYETEIYYLSEIHTDEIESIILSEK